MGYDLHLERNFFGVKQNIFNNTLQINITDVDELKELSTVTSINYVEVIFLNYNFL